MPLDSNSSNLGALPNPYPCPESDLQLIFGPRVPLPTGSGPLIIELLGGMFGETWLAMVPQGRETPLPGIGRRKEGIQVLLETRETRAGIPMVTTSIAADAITNIVYYMLVEGRSGFFGNRIGLSMPGTGRARVIVGTITIQVAPRSVVAIGEIANDTRGFTTL